MKALDSLLNTSSGFGQNCISTFGIFFNCAFHIMSVVATTNLSFYGSHLEWPEIWHADVSWTPSELIRFWWFSSFGRHFNLVKQVKFGVSGDFRQYALNKWLNIWHGDSSWPPFNWLQFGHSLLIFLILAVFNLTGRNGPKLHLPWWCILTTFRADSILVMVCWIS